jgi:hypothetical protein
VSSSIEGADEGLIRSGRNANANFAARILEKPERLRSRRRMMRHLIG